MNKQFSDNIDSLKNIMGFNSIIIDVQLTEIIDNIESLDLNNDYEVLGEYNFKKKIWYWSYILQKYNNSLTITSRGLLNYGAKLDESSTSEQLLMKNILINSTIKIKENINVIYIINIVQYLTKNIKKIYRKVTNDTIIYYIVKYN